jgi:hypothetical protein
MRGVPEDASQERLLEAISEFLVSNEGKKMAAYSLSEKTYEQMYLIRRKIDPNESSVSKNQP